LWLRLPCVQAPDQRAFTVCTPRSAATATSPRQARAAARRRLPRACCSRPQDLPVVAHHIAPVVFAPTASVLRQRPQAPAGALAAAADMTVRQKLNRNAAHRWAMLRCACVLWCAVIHMAVLRARVLSLQQPATRRHPTPHARSVPGLWCGGGVCGGGGGGGCAAHTHTHTHTHTRAHTHTHTHHTHGGSTPWHHPATGRWSRN
jgi:hypothetical protein